MINYPEVLKRIGRGEVAPVYYLYGEEDLLREEALKAFISTLIPAGGPAFDLESMSGETVSAEGILASLQTPPFLAPRRVVLIRDADRLEAAALQRLAAYLENPVESSCLVIEAKKLDRRTRFAQVLERKGVVLRFPPLRGEAVRRWLKERAERLGKRLTPDAMELLLTLLGEDLRALSNELDKVILFVGGRRDIEASDVEAVVGEQRARTVFELVEAVGGRRIEASLQCLSRLLETGEEPLAILGMLARQIRLLIKVQEMRRRGLGTEEIGKILGLPPRFVSGLLEQAASFPAPQLEKALLRLLQADSELKGGREGRTTLELLVVDLCKGGAREGM
ncbi:MAG: DNA polymerase III subunit delta, partial [Candidatus Methylomirabilales bacterium]